MDNLLFLNCTDQEHVKISQNPADMNVSDEQSLSDPDADQPIILSDQMVSADEEINETPRPLSRQEKVRKTKIYLPFKMNKRFDFFMTFLIIL